MEEEQWPYPNGLDILSKDKNNNKIRNNKKTFISPTLGKLHFTTAKNSWTQQANVAKGQELNIRNSINLFLYPRPL